ncbi:MAG: MXAN_2562 family outer membrane beta-barrel protein, partial [Kofleriaceae bacterium]|nr:MXAN_2562 family outer membrane beta-barrel protein [Kofleriaceae bacterium]
GLVTLDPAFVCGETTEATAEGIAVKDLENGVAYTIVLVAVDRYGNASSTFLSQTITPQPATDFWEDLHDRGSDVEGGFCLIAETYGDGSGLTQTLRAFRDETLASTAFGRALVDVYYGSIGQLGTVVHGSLVLKIIAGIALVPLIAIALLWHTLTLPGLLALVVLAVVWKSRREFLGRRRRGAPAPRAISRPRSRRGLLATLALLLPSVASAQGPTPYWDDEVRTVDEEAEGLVKWHVGIRIGPYTPAIDKQIDMDPGPYEQMFGGSQWLPMLDVDRILWRGFGQLGVGGSIGYMQKTAKAWEDGSSPDDPMRPRSPGNENTFHLMPLVLSGIYRFTYLDDEFGIPIVPYARGGVGYYLWWLTTNGDLSKVCWDGTDDRGCDADKAIGGSFGIVGAVGIAIRAERIDPAAASSMRSSGIQHAGFFAEWSVGKVDGFRPETKLSVGDSTWFAGASFEF